MARLLKPITICVDGMCWPTGSLGFGLGAFPELELEQSKTPEEGTGHYAHLFSDASIVHSIRVATQYITDSGTRAALESGIASAVKAMEKRGAADKIKITLGD
jgi:hypothetical protein